MEKVKQSFDLQSLVRENIRNLVPYSTARDDFQGMAEIFLDANENSMGSPLPGNFNRYPDPMQGKLKQKLSLIKGLSPDQIFLGNGSDECIDLLFRAFCIPGLDQVILCPPTYGMYEVCAHLNDIPIRLAPLDQSFQLDLEAIGRALDPRTKLIFLCSPNNPTGNSLRYSDIETILNNFDGLLVLDEAYINFSRHRSWIPGLAEYPNLVILQTLSKSWGLAGLRVGMALGSVELVRILNRVKYPYNIGQDTQELALEALDRVDQVNEWTRILVQQRERLEQELPKLGEVVQVYPSDANFLLVRMKDAQDCYRYLMRLGTIVRDRSRILLCAACLRITVGSPGENDLLLEQLSSYVSSPR